MINFKPKPSGDAELRAKRLRYRSWHRGCKETDLVLGNFADHHLSGLNPAQLDIYEQLLEEDDADIWEWLTDKGAPPSEYGELLAVLKKTGLGIGE